MQISSQYMKNDDTGLLDLADPRPAEWDMRPMGSFD